MPQPRKPLELHKLEGTFRPSRHAPEPVDSFPPLDPAPPEGLSDKAAGVWRETVAAAPWLRAVDKPLLMRYCEAVGEKATRESTLALIRLANALRLTPSTRPRGAAPAPVSVSKWGKLREQTEKPPEDKSA